jgi:aldose 1-epimerase
VRTSERRVSLSYELHPRAGYPFALALTVSYELASGGIVMTLHATNVGPERAPFGAGLHPYLTPGTAEVDDVALEVPAGTRVPVDDRLLPCGPAVAVDGTELDFRRSRRLGGLRLDACFGDLHRSPAGVARVRVGTHAGAGQLTVWMDERFRFVQVFTADAAIAVEPMTCAPDAFNSGDGLVVLEPGASFTGRCGLIAAGF